jgi:hypothetical protein
LSKQLAIGLVAMLLVCLPIKAGELRDPVAEMNTKLTPAQFDRLARGCAPGVPAEIMRALARTESAMYPYALSINHPATSARQLGYDGKMLLLRQPSAQL